ncbi:MAG: hypothetical protein IH600_02900 [Bacteroidetes bacterium]|nr:hypothetical protein [Bacteroidota bacterium]
MKQLAFIATVFIVSVIALGYAAAHSNYTGRTMMSGSQGCGGCHASLNSSVTVSISGPDQLTAGEKGTFQVTISGGSGSSVCVDIAASAGTLAPADANTKTSKGELVTNGVKRYSGGSYTYSFFYTAPASPQSVTLYATGMSTMQTFNFAPNKTVTVTSVSTGLNDVLPAAPVTIQLEQNFPNPFNPSTSVSYGLSAPADVRLVVFDAVGNEAGVLDEGLRESGTHHVSWNAAGLSSGVYFCRLTARTADGQTTIAIRKMSLQK